MERKQVLIICSYCEEEVLKNESEVKRNNSLGRKNYCSLKCNGYHMQGNLVSEYDISKHCKNRSDQYSPFREYVRRTKARRRESNVTPEYLKSVWELQNGKCAYLGIDLVHPKLKGINDRIYTASLDRIDSSKGYVEGNVQFISTMINYLKNDCTHEQTIQMIGVIKKSNYPKN